MQDKGCDGVIMNQSNDFDKCLSKLKRTQFNKSDHDPTGTLKNKIIWKILWKRNDAQIFM